MIVDLILQVVLEEGDPQIAALPAREDFRRWAERALAGREGTAELTIRIVGDEEGAELNQSYRNKEGPTNVMSFLYQTPPDMVEAMLFGDLVLCAPVVAREAAEQGKPVAAHWAHMTVHGILHLLGHDHIEPAQAQAMEALERDILADLGFANPYEADSV